MAKGEKKAENTGAQGSDYEKTMLEILDKEIAAASVASESRDATPDDVDALINSLLKQAITVSNAQPPDNEPDTGDWQAREPAVSAKRQEPVVLAQKEEAPPAKPQEAVPQVVEQVQPAPGERMPSTEQASSELWMTTFPEAEAELPQPPAEFVPTEEIPSLSPDTLPEWVPAFRPVATKPPLRGRMLIVAGAFLLLLTGTGIVYLTGLGSGDSSASKAPAQSAPSKEDDEAQSLKAIVPPQPLRQAPERTAIPAGRRPSSPVSDAGESAKNPAVPMVETKAPASFPTAASGAAASSGAGAAPRTAAEKTAPVTPALPEPPPITPTARVLEDTPPQNAPITATVAQALPRASASLDSLPARDQVAFRAVPGTKTVVPAQVITRVPPVYSDAARRSHALGTVVVDIFIDEKGRVTKATATSGPGILRLDAVNAVMQWRFRPAMLDGNGIASTSTVTVVFK